MPYPHRIYRETLCDHAPFNEKVDDIRKAHYPDGCHLLVHHEHPMESGLGQQIHDTTHRRILVDVTRGVLIVLHNLALTNPGQIREDIHIHPRPPGVHDRVLYIPRGGIAHELAIVVDHGDAAQPHRVQELERLGSARAVIYPRDVLPKRQAGVRHGLVQRSRVAPVGDERDEARLGNDADACRHTDARRRIGADDRHAMRATVREDRAQVQQGIVLRAAECRIHRIPRGEVGYRDGSGGGRLGI
mmetsp:Transcript_11212/g.27559  ORF Transcript_11212/g.27559 Transcript_11212/m.27559 type:complete len:245 (+) Transcript_11212:183-917(+)